MRQTLQAETDWGYGADPQVISRLFSELVARGHFKLELALLQRFFVSLTTIFYGYFFQFFSLHNNRASLHDIPVFAIFLHDFR